MKKLALIVIVFFSVTSAHGQILNGSFENDSTSDLSDWQWTCLAEPFSSAPAEGGNWCIKVYGGNTQGCFPGYAYQKLPAITNGQSFVLSGWAFQQSSPTPVGIYFGTINNGTISLQSGDTTSATSWTLLSVQSGFSLSAGDTAAVVLYGGLAGGPLQCYGFFDLINLQQITGMNDNERVQTIRIFPNPCTNQTTLQTSIPLINATLTVDNIFGQVVTQRKNINGQSVTLQLNDFPTGLYLIRLTEEHNQIATKKIIITDLH